MDVILGKLYPAIVHTGCQLFNFTLSTLYLQFCEGTRMQLYFGRTELVITTATNKCWTLLHAFLTAVVLCSLSLRFYVLPEILSAPARQRLPFPKPTSSHILSRDTQNKSLLFEAITTAALTLSAALPPAGRHHIHKTAHSLLIRQHQMLSPLITMVARRWRRRCRRAGGGTGAPRRLWRFGRGGGELART